VSFSPRTRPAAKIAPAMGYVAFVWTPGGYELRAHDGDPPPVGAAVEENGSRFMVVKVAPSPLPDDSRRCAYLQPLP
jgi:hypothetical protein